MKKKMILGLLCVSAMMLSLVACGGDDDNTPSYSKEALVGKWINTRVDWNEDGELSHEEFSGNSRSVVFSADGTATVHPYNLFEDEKHGTFKWTLEGNRLTTVEEDGDTEVYTISKLTETELILVWDDSDPEGVFVETHTFRKATK